MPLILQHAGHSRTVVGFEKYQNGVNLLIFDPSKYVTIVKAFLDFSLIAILQRRVPSEIRQTALSTAHPAHLPSSHHDFGSKRVSNIVNHILHPISGHNGKRPASEVTDRGDGVAAKRARSGSPKDVVVVDVDEAEEISSASNVRKPISLGHNQVDPNSVLKLFRVRASSLK